jgi:hypothetical protein
MHTHRRLWLGVGLMSVLACASVVLAFASSGATGVRPPTSHSVPAMSLQKILLPAASAPPPTATTTTPVTTHAPVIATSPAQPAITTTTATTIAAGIPADQRVQQTSVLCSNGTSISPAPASDSPATSQQELISTLESGGRSLGEQQDSAGPVVQPTILYGLVTDTEYGRINPDGSVTPFFVNYPAWIVEYQGISAPMTGSAGPAPSPNGSSTTTTSSATTTSTQPAGAGSTWTFYDAQSGSYRFGLSC